MMVVEFAFGMSELVTGVEDDLHESVRVYIGYRHEGVHFIVADPVDAQAVREAWATLGHVGFLRSQIPYELLLCDAPDDAHPHPRRAGSS